MSSSSRSASISAAGTLAASTPNSSSLAAARIFFTASSLWPEANAIHSDLNGLSFRKEQVGGRTRIRATGKVNGGGERVVLYAEEGDIHISAQSLNPMISPAVP